VRNVTNPKIRNIIPIPTADLLPSSNAGPTSMGSAATSQSVPRTLLDRMTLLDLLVISCS
jgi:hypothetical protein